MDMQNLSILIGAVMAILTGLGGAVAWAVAKANAQSARFDRLEERYNKLHREHTLVLVQVERFRLALQIAVATIARLNPSDAALAHIQALLVDHFVFPTEAQAKTPPDMKEVLDEIDEKDTGK
jgi:hypothetical protein